MDINQLLVTLIAAACPVSLFVGIIGTFVALHIAGVRWPWEQEQVSPPEHQQASQDSKKHKRKVQYEYHVGSYLICHLSLVVIGRS